MPTIMDVAKRAGVSRSTVSLVINKSPLVKTETRKLVEQVIREINYVPNSNARGLSAKVTNNIGVVFMQDYLPDTPLTSYDNDQHIGLCSFNISNGIMAGLLGTYYGMVTERFLMRDCISCSHVLSACGWIEASLWNSLPRGSTANPFTPLQNI